MIFCKQWDVQHCGWQKPAKTTKFTESIFKTGSRWSRKQPDSGALPSVHGTVADGELYKIHWSDLLRRQNFGLIKTPKKCSTNSRTFTLWKTTACQFLYTRISVCFPHSQYLCLVHNQVALWLLDAVLPESGLRSYARMSSAGTWVRRRSASKSCRSFPVKQDISIINIIRAPLENLIAYENVATV